MTTHREKAKTQDGTQDLPQKQAAGKGSFRFADHRPATVAQLKMQAAVQRSPQLQQLKEFAAFANQTPDPEPTHQLAPSFPVESPLPIQRKLKIGSTEYRTFNAYKTSSNYEDVFTWLKEQQPKGIGKKGYDATLKQYVANDTVEAFQTLAHFRNNLLYDLRNGIWTKGSNDTATIRYMTRRGWNNAATNKTTINDAHATQSISLYRTMNLAEAKKILIDGDISQLRGHVGDYAAAMSYLYRATDDRVMVEFKLKAGAHRDLFSTANTAVVAGGVTTGHIRTRHETNDSSYAVASAGEGLHATKIGIKSEVHGTAGFSLAAHNDVATDVLKPLIQSIVPVMIGKANDGNPVPITKTEFRNKYTE